MSTNLTAELLRAAREVIAAPEHWTIRMFARDRFGLPVDSTDPRAISFCAVGALQRAVHLRPELAPAFMPARNALGDQAAKSVTPSAQALTVYNDHRSHAEVLDLYDRAIGAVDEEKA